MRWETHRQVARNGNSYTIAIPRVALLNMGLLRGERMRLVYDDRDNVVYVFKAAFQLTSDSRAARAFVRWETFRIISKNGNCLTIALPHKVMFGMSLTRGELVKVTYDDKLQVIELRRATPLPKTGDRAYAARAMRPSF